MKRMFLILLVSLLAGCSRGVDKYAEVPVKNEISGVNIEASSVNTKNIDNYLFRDDVFYVDLRPYSWVLKDGHIAGFSFYPFYDFIAHLKYEDRLFQMNGSVGTVGCYVPKYEESEQIIRKIFPADKYIFAISQSGLECIYFFNLLIQLGYDVANLYNIGGFGVGTGLTNVAYKNLENPKYLVKGNNLLENTETTFNFMKDLTPIENN